MRRLCNDIVVRLPQLAHIDPGRILFAFCQARNRTRFGRHATLTPLRFQGGSHEMVRRGRKLRSQPVFDACGREVLYILSFYLPRFLDEPFHEKMATAIHELWHISPNFDGDIRRHSGRCYAHSSSKAKYDQQMHALAELYLKQKPPEGLLAPLRLSFNELCRQQGPVFGARVRRPRLIPVV